MAMANNPLAFTPAPELSCGTPLLVLVEPTDFVTVAVAVVTVVFAAVVFESAAKVPPNASVSGEMLMLLSLAAVEYVSITPWSG